LARVSLNFSAAGADMLAFLLPLVIALPDAHNAQKTRYIVKFHTRASDTGFKALLLGRLPAGSVNVTTSFARVLNGGFAADISSEGLAFLASQPGLSIEPVQRMHALLPVGPRPRAAPFSSSATRDEAVSPAVSGLTPWGLDRIDQAGLPLNDMYAAVAQTSLNMVHAYVIDTGVYLAHDELRAAASPDPADHWSAIGDSASAARDSVGHGTHCAGTIGGALVGVARGVRLHAVKVLGDDGSGSNEDVMRGMDWVVAHLSRLTRKEGGKRPPAVVSMSLGGAYSKFINDAVDDLVARGVVVVVAAGNDADDACAYSPASASSAITVGSSTSTDEPSSFTNYGECVDVFAPGSKILSAGITAPDAYATMSGTSMAAPHVAGVVARAALAALRQGRGDDRCRRFPDGDHLGSRQSGRG
jgi:subtilisin family serine protease